MNWGGTFFLSFLWGEQKGGQLTFYSVFSEGKKYAGRYVQKIEVFIHKLN